MTGGIGRYGWLLVGVAALAVMLLLPAPDGMSEKAWRVAAVGVLMAIWWVTEAVPLAATAVVPVVLFPSLSIAEIGATTAHFGNPLIFLFLGGFVIALAMARWNMNRRIALVLIRWVGTSPAALIGGFMAATAAISMWVSNTATAVMMLPIGLSVVTLVRSETGPPRRGEDRFAVALMLAIAYGASIGGMATLIGTPPNALLAAYMLENHGVRIGFAQWMAFGVPLSAAMLLAAWLLLTRVMFRVQGGSVAGANQAIEAALAALGPLSRPERRVAAVFAATALGWIVLPSFEPFLPWPVLPDPAIAMAGALALFILPAGTGTGERLMDWESLRALPWDVLVLFGGGLTLAAAIDQSGLAAWVGTVLHGLAAWPTVLLIAGLVTVTVAMSELASNTATAAAFLPLAAAIAASAGLDPLVLTIPVVLGASCGFMMPVATPPNTIVFGSGMLTVAQMCRSGLWLNIIGIVLITALGYGVLGVLFRAGAAS